MESMINHIESSPQRCGGKPCVVGTRIRVWDIYVWNVLQGRSPEDIVHNFPQLSLADVHGALAYFWDHQQEIRRQMKQAENLAERVKAESGPGLLAGLKADDAATHSIPSR
jgi:uncharacterized protein (DUF433 family)